MQRFFFLFILFSSINYAQDWHTDKNLAFELAHSENKPVLLLFQGSDWCPPCQKMEKEIWESSEFIAYAEKNLILLKADFPKKEENKPAIEVQRQNSELFRKYNSQGYFPFVLLLNENGDVLLTTGYLWNETPDEFISSIAVQ